MKMKLFLTLIVGFVLCGSVVAQARQMAISRGAFATIMSKQLKLRPNETNIMYKTFKRLAALRSLKQPVYSNKFISYWAGSVAVSVYSYDFVKYKRQFYRVSSNFTNRGWKNFLFALKKSRQVELVKTKRLEVSATLGGAPMIIKQGVMSGVYSWKVQMPLLVKFQSRKESADEPMIITMIISRTGIDVNSKGIGVDTFIAATKPSKT